MLTNNPNLTAAAAALLQRWGDAWEYARKALDGGVENPYDTAQFVQLRTMLDKQRTIFLRLARDEVQPKPQDRAQLPEGEAPYPHPARRLDAL
jgi:hypothetical protein